jgi:hypothetical protein
VPDRSDRDNKRTGPFERAIFGEMARSRSFDLPSDSAPGYASVNSIKKFYARNSPHSGLRSARIAVCPCGLPAHYYGVAITIATYSSPCDGSASFCLWLTCVLDAVRGAVYQTALAAEPLENARILLVILLQSSRSTFSWGSFPRFFAFKGGMLDTQISASGGWPTVSAR